jgi:hypothetical protein
MNRRPTPTDADGIDLESASSASSAVKRRESEPPMNTDRVTAKCKLQTAKFKLLASLRPRSTICVICG